MELQVAKLEAAVSALELALVTERGRVLDLQVGGNFPQTCCQNSSRLQREFMFPRGP